MYSKKIYTVVCKLSMLFVLSILISCGAKEEFTVMTFNIRYNNPSDGVNQWSNRKDVVKDIVINNNCDFVGFQEVLPDQYKFLKSNLNTYSSLYRTREISELIGEGCPLFYRKDKWSIIDSGHFWLSDTPNVVASNTWNAACIRIATWALFKNRKSSKTVVVYNTHYDHVSEEARGKSSSLFIKHAEQFSNNINVVVMGDLNADEKDKAIKSFTNANYVDSYRFINKDKTDKDFTFNGWGDKCTHRIDYVFSSPELNVKRASVLHEKYDSRFPSDHLPVVVGFEM